VTITWADLTDTYSTDTVLAAVDVDLQTEILALVHDTLSASEFVSAQRLRAGQMYMAAHLGTFLTASTSGDGVYPIERERVGGLEREYTVPLAAGLSDLGATKYGQLYQAMVNVLPASMGWVV
jgi:hypothetical protein